MSFRVPLNERGETFNAERCPEHREGSTRQKHILRFAQDDSPRRVRFLPTVEMTERTPLQNCDTASDGGLRGAGGAEGNPGHGWGRGSQGTWQKGKEGV